MQKVCYKMGINTWVDLKEQCPIDISRIITYANRFDAHVGVRVSLTNLARAKRSLIEARGQLELMITTLNQLLYDRKILQSRVDEVLHMWFMDNLGRLMRKIDEKEKDLLIVHDNPNEMNSEVGVSHLSAYAKLLKIVSQAVIFEALIKATEEYNQLEDGAIESIQYTEEVSEQKLNENKQPLFLTPDGIETTKDFSEVTKKLKDGSTETKQIMHRAIIVNVSKDKEEKLTIRKNKRTFLYILFHILQVTLFTLGSLSRDKPTGGFTKKETVNNVPGSWKNLLSENLGQKQIAKAHKEETGETVNINLPPELQNQNYESDGQDVMFEETYPDGDDNDEEDDENV